MPRLVTLTFSSSPRDATTGRKGNSYLTFRRGRSASCMFPGRHWPRRHEPLHRLHLPRPGRSTRWLAVFVDAQGRVLVSTGSSSRAIGRRPEPAGPLPPTGGAAGSFQEPLHKINLFLFTYRSLPPPCWAVGPLPGGRGTEL